jgi:hypothetical protein
MHDNGNLLRLPARDEALIEMADHLTGVNISKSCWLRSTDCGQ